MSSTLATVLIPGGFWRIDPQQQHHGADDVGDPAELDAGLLALREHVPGGDVDRGAHTIIAMANP